MTYQPPSKELTNAEILKMINHDGQISLQKVGVYQPYFEICCNDTKDNKTIDNNFDEIDEWIKNTKKISCIYIWSGCEISILSTGIYNTQKEGYVIKERDDYDDITENTKIYTQKEIEEYINKIRAEKKYIFVDNKIENSYHFMKFIKVKEFTSAKEMFESRNKY